MPYTPPGHTPGPSTPPPPPRAKSSHTRSSSAQYGPVHHTPATAPKSSSYLSKHRRTPSFQTPEQDGSRDEAGSHTSTVDFACDATPVSNRRSIRPAPSPATAHSAMPPGAVLSPPDSYQNSSDEEVSLQKRRGRVLENLEELQKAIRGIEQRREGSPTEVTVPADLLNALEHARQAERSLISEINMKNNGPRTAPERSAMRKSRSDTAIHRPEIRVNESLDNSDGDEGVETPSWPSRMVRKKSGELVKPALRASSSTRRRPLSMPGTPTYGKAVHFDSHLEQVKHFSHVDRPLAVSAGASPNESYDSDTEFPWGTDQQVRGRQAFEWDIETPNFPKETPERMMLPVRVEKVFVSGDNKSLTGYVAVQNLAFHKSVVVRFTMDHWKTTSEVLAEFSHDLRKNGPGENFDRFSFNVRFADHTNVETKVMFFCVRYNVNGQEFWDNNSHVNFRVEFRKKRKSKTGSATHSVTPGLPPAPVIGQPPRSRGLNSPRARPMSMPVSFDDFANGFDRFGDAFSDGSTADLMGDSAAALNLRDLKKSSGQAVIPEAPQKKQPAQGQAFGNRYDFGASLTAAIQAAKDTLGDRSGFDDQDGVPRAKQVEHAAEPVERVSVTNLPSKPASSGGQQPSVAPDTSTALSAASGVAKPDSATAPLQSSSYNDLINKYCFFGTAKASSPMAAPSAPRTKSGLSTAAANPSEEKATASDQSLESIGTSSEPLRPSRVEPSAYNFIQLAEPKRQSPSPPHSSATDIRDSYEPYQSHQGGFSFSGSHTPTAIVT